MKKLLPFLFLFNSMSHAVEIQQSQIDTDAYVILLGTYVGINDARRFAKMFNEELIYILKEDKHYTVRIVNIESKLLALQKLKKIKQSVPDAMIWKKMKFLEKKRFNKLQSPIYTIESDEVVSKRDNKS